MKEPTREVAAAIIIGTCGRVLLQQRDDVPGILYPGMIGLFGGHREGDETFIECVQREVEEEIGHRVPLDDFAEMATMRVAYPDGSTVQGAYYIVRGVPTEKLAVTEGSLCPVEIADLPAMLHRMTPSACFVSRLFLMDPTQHHRPAI